MLALLRKMMLPASAGSEKLFVLEIFPITAKQVPKTKNQPSA
jgi:hypothetical protein